MLQLTKHLNAVVEGVAFNHLYELQPAGPITSNDETNVRVSLAYDGD
jgi:hypothetical protein